MPDPLLVTKLSLPKLRHILVSREKIFRQLSAGVQDGHLLTLVSAPAGYGKTTAIRMWVEEAGYPVTWVTLENSNNDLKQFLTYVLTFRENNSLVVNGSFASSGGIPKSTALGRLKLHTSFELEVPTKLRCAGFESSHACAARRTSASLPQPTLRMPETFLLSTVGKLVLTKHIIRGEMK